MMGKKKTVIRKHKSGTSAQILIENFLKKNYDSRYNEIKSKVEFKKKKEKQFIPLTEYHLNTVHRELALEEISCSLPRLRGLFCSSFSKRYNPFLDYLTSLPVHKNGEDYIQKLAETVNTTNNPLWYEVFRKWIVALVASLIKDEIINHTVIVFSGGQGIGKTTWTLKLVPTKLGTYVYSGIINPDNKDTLIHLSECMLINLDELENLTKSEQGSIKEMITKSSINVRKPYGYNSETIPRRASFAGSVNGIEFLSDTSGSRRFLCFEVIDINNNHRVKIDRVYAQAKYLYESGFQYWFDQDEIKTIQQNNEQFRYQSVEEELLLTYFDPCEIPDATDILTTTDILLYLQGKISLPMNDTVKQKLGKALRGNKFVRTSKLNKYAYAVKEKLTGVNLVYASNSPEGTRLLAMN